MSRYTYLYAFPIQQMLAFSLRRSVPFAFYLLLALLSTLVAAVLSWYLVERWFVRGHSAQAERHHADADEGTVDETIAGAGQRLN